MNYTLHQLRIFLKITETLSITEAARQLHLSQPAISIQMKNFQQQFEVPLFEIINKKIYITDFGREIAASARKIVSEADAISNKILSFSKYLTGRLKIATVSTGKYVIPYFLSAFIKSHEGIELHLEVTSKSKVLDHLEKNEVDFSLVPILPHKIRLHKIELVADKLFLVGNSENSPDISSYDKKIFETVPLIFREQDSDTRFAVEKFLEKKKIQCIRKMELADNEAVKQAVIAGLGYSILPLLGMRNELLNKQLQIIPVRELPLKLNWYLIWRADKKLSPTAAAYIDFLRKEKQHIIGKYFSWTEVYG